MTPTEICTINIREERLMDYLKYHPKETSEVTEEHSKNTGNHGEETIQSEKPEVIIEVGLKITVEDFKVDPEETCEEGFANQKETEQDRQDFKVDPEETLDASEVAFGNQKETEQDREDFKVDLEETLYASEVAFENQKDIVEVFKENPETVFQAIIRKHFKALEQNRDNDQEFLREEEAMSPAMRRYEELRNKLASGFKKHHTMHEKYNLKKRRRESFRLFNELEALKKTTYESKEFKQNLSSQAIELSKLELELQTPKRKKPLPKITKISATSTPFPKMRKSRITQVVQKFKADENGMVEIGPNGTIVAKTFLVSLNWSLSGAALTRKILVAVFGRDTLASHTLTAKLSPVIVDCEKPLKNQLDPIKVEDVIHFINHTALTAKEIKSAITTKCADENKMLRLRKNKQIDIFETEAKHKSC